MNPLVVIDGVRTPFCKAGTALTGLGAADLGLLSGGRDEERYDQGRYARGEPQMLAMKRETRADRVPWRSAYVLPWTIFPAASLRECRYIRRAARAVVAVAIDALDITVV